MGGMPEIKPIIQRIMVLIKPKEKSLASIAKASDTGKAIKMDTIITRNVPHKAGSNPYDRVAEDDSVERTNKF